eukprot:IDg22156t1
MGVRYQRYVRNGVGSLLRRRDRPRRRATVAARRHLRGHPITPRAPTRAVSSRSMRGALAPYATSQRARHTRECGRARQPRRAKQRTADAAQVMSIGVKRCVERAHGEGGRNTNISTLAFALFYTVQNIAAVGAGL